MSLSISEHFTYREVIRSQTAERRGISNNPSEVELKRIRAVAKNILEPVRVHYGKPFSPSSWYRSPALSIAIGSSEYSQHCKGEAVDFEVPGVDNRTLAEWIAENLEFDQLILELYKKGQPNSGWVHCSYVEDRPNRKEILWYDGKIYRRGFPE